MKTIKIISLLVVYCIACVCGEAAASVKDNGKLSVKGTSLVNEHGEKTMLKGISYGWHNWWPRFYNASTVTCFANSWGASVVRAAIGVDPDDGYIQNPDKALSCVQAVADAAIANDIYVIIDWHSHHIRLQEAKAFFTQMATRYKGVPNVIYEIFNEPVDDSWDAVKAYSIEIIKTIRAIEPNAVILVGTPHWDQDIHLAADSPITGYDNIMYTLHFYANTHKQSLRDRGDYALNRGLPLFVSECAGMEASGDGDVNHEEWSAWLDWMQRNSISWVAWSISDKDETCSMIKSSGSSDGDWKEEDLKEWGHIVKKELRGFNLQTWTLVDVDATSETKALYRNLSKLADKHILFGQQDATNYGHSWTIGENRSDVKDVCGAHPAMIGDDFAGLTVEDEKRLEENKKQLLKTITETYERGGVITICWHGANPVNGGSFYYEQNPVKAVADILPGGSKYQQYLIYLDRIAEVAKAAKGKKGELIPIIFRPFHEFDGDWFWWGKAHCSKEEFVQLWRHTVDYLKDTKQVHNFLYAFSPDCRFFTEEEYLERYPGDDYVDILGTDNYWDFRADGGNDPKLAEAKLKIVSGIAKQKKKLAALTETGLEGVVNPEWYTTVLLPILKNPAIKLAYVMVWRNANYNPNHYYAPFPGHPAENDFKKFRADPLVCFEDELPILYK